MCTPIYFSYTHHVCVSSFFYAGRLVALDPTAAQAATAQLSVSLSSRISTLPLQAVSPPAFTVTANAAAAAAAAATAATSNAAAIATATAATAKAAAAAAAAAAATTATTAASVAASTGSGRFTLIPAGALSALIPAGGFSLSSLIPAGALSSLIPAGGLGAALIPAGGLSSLIPADSPIPAGASLLLAKLLATSFCLGSGLVGGTFAPSLFLGAVLGGACRAS